MRAPGFDPAMVATLPWLDGVKLARRGAGFAPIAGMKAVADLLASAKLEAEGLYRTWQVVSLARLASDGEIEVHTRDGMKVDLRDHGGLPPPDRPARPADRRIDGPDPSADAGRPLAGAPGAGGLRHLGADPGRTCARRAGRARSRRRRLGAPHHLPLVLQPPSDSHREL